MDRAASRSNALFLWTGFGFAVLMLMGVSACALLPIAWHVPATPSRHFPTSALIPYLPALAPVGVRPAIKAIRGNKDQKMMQQEVQRDLGRMSGSLQRSGSPLMSSVLDRPVPLLRRQYAPPPTPPPPSGGGDSGGGGGAALKRYSASEAAAILDAWIARVKVYCLSSQFDDPGGLAPEHRATLQQLELFRSFALSPPRKVSLSALRSGAAEEKVFWGLINNGVFGDGIEGAGDDEPQAIAGGHCSSLGPLQGNPLAVTTADEGISCGTLKIKYISVNPKDLRKPSGFGIPAMKQALDLLSTMLSVTLVFDTANGDS